MTSDLFTADYFERGKSLGISWYENYRWMPERSATEAHGFLAAMKAPHDVSVTDYGCAKGFLVRALLGLGCDARGVDLSAYALGQATLGTGGRLYTVEEAASLSPTALGFCKDTLEHCAGREELHLTLQLMARLAQRWLVIVPFGEEGKYRIPEYEADVTHVLREDEVWWGTAFDTAGLRVERFAYRVSGLKDHWAGAHPRGNGFFTLTSTRSAP